MLGERKSDIFKLLPADSYPETVLIAARDVQHALAAAEQIGYPMIAKPDKGERGKLVKKIENELQLIAYAKKCPVPFLLQAYVNYPVELGVFFIKPPGSEKGMVTSIVKKEFLTVTGNGTDTVYQLLQADQRAKLLYGFSKPENQTLLQHIPNKDERIIVEPIGNHCRGTQFLDNTKLASPELHAAFSRLTSKIEGFHFGRFDLRCQSIESLTRLEDFQILELNGAGAEPGHIYQPGFSLREAYRTILWHLKALAEISLENHRQGIPYWTFSAGLAKLKAIRTYNQLLNKKG
ncbi:hypothetical protein C7460_10940 [Marinoscillum furvescens DSM 4134]|uniref:ATP-grasp domain-containing protein n=2 Tax=Marinoscillum furvescens TaxID=1026 RepID=A0A3D9L296_MARFU|nr:hypothetical protein C7460_10940 [Marinoscillum furvescens DSM 4134]